jgi:hypothetical protein
MTFNFFPRFILIRRCSYGACRIIRNAFRYSIQAQNFAVKILAAEHWEISGQYAQKNKHELSADVFRIGATGLPLIVAAHLPQ